MNTKEVRESLRDTRVHGVDAVKRFRRRTRALPRIRKVLGALASTGVLFDVEFLSIDATYDNALDSVVSFHLKKEEKDSALVRRLVQVTGKDAQKGKAYSGDSIVANLTHEFVKYVVYGYVPATCRVVEETVTIPATPERTEIRQRIVCTD